MSKTLVLDLRDPAFLLLYGKDGGAVSSAQKTLRNLGEINAFEVFPPLLERIYSSLETLTESHRTLASIGALGVTANTLFNGQSYPEGCRHLIPLLHLTLPGLDINDYHKTIMTLMFYSNVGLGIPVAKILELDGSGFSGETLITVETLISQKHELMEWLSEFLNRVFLIIENLPDQHETGKNVQSIEKTVLDILAVIHFASPFGNRLTFLVYVWCAFPATFGRTLGYGRE
jgi:proteasome activator subunit 4